MNRSWSGSVKALRQERTWRILETEMPVPMEHRGWEENRPGENRRERQEYITQNLFKLRKVFWILFQVQKKKSRVWKKKDFKVPEIQVLYKSCIIPI